MRRLLLVLTLAACSHAKSSGPAWPEMPKADDELHADGGESLAPRESSAVASVIEKSDDDDDKPVADEKPAATAPAEEDKPAVTPSATPTPPEDVIQSE